MTSEQRQMELRDIARRFGVIVGGMDFSPEDATYLSKAVAAQILMRTSFKSRGAAPQERAHD